jgi:hypothetical protein
MLKRTTHPRSLPWWPLLAGCASRRQAERRAGEDRPRRRRGPRQRRRPGGAASPGRAGAGRPQPGHHRRPANVARIVYFDYDSYEIKPEFQASSRPRALPEGQPAAPRGDRRPHRRARRPRIQPGARPAPRRSRAPRARAARRHRQPDRGGELRQGKAGRAQGSGEEAPGRRTAASRSPTDDAAHPLCRAALAGRGFCCCARWAPCRAVRGRRGPPRHPRPAAACRGARRQQAEELRRATGENEQLRRSLLDLQNQIESLRGELARMRGRRAAHARPHRGAARQKDIAQGVEDRLRKFEPVQGDSVDGREFRPTRNEQRDFEAALGVFRKGEFAGAQTAFAEFVKRYPQSGYRPSALFWLGNAQYATATTAAPSPTSARCCAGARPCRAPRGRAVDRQLPDRAEGQRRGTPHAGRPDQGLSAVRSRQAAASGSRLKLRGAAPTQHAARARHRRRLARRFGGLERLYGVPGARRIRRPSVAGRRHRRRRLLGRRGAGAQRRRLADLVDLDHVAESNINRQVHALDSTVGQAKVEAMRERIAQIHPGLQGARRRRIRRARQLAALLRHKARTDRRCVIDACDQVKAKVAMAAWARASARLFITVGAAGGKRLAHKVDIDDLSLTTHDPCWRRCATACASSMARRARASASACPASSAAKRGAAGCVVRDR